MREKISVLLNHDKPEELKLLGTIDVLKQNRSFAKTFRDGIQLIVDLRHGKTDMLEELFPWVLEQKVTVVPSLSESFDNPTDAFESVISRLENLFTQQNMTLPPATSGNISRDTLPPGEGETPELELKKENLSQEEQFEKDYKNGELGNWNALIQMNIGLDGDTHNLKDEIVLYGLRKPTDGKPNIRPIPESKLAERHRHLLAEKDKPQVMTKS